MHIFFSRFPSLSLSLCSLHRRSFNWATLGYTCVSFTIGALAWWSPEFGLNSMKVLDKKNANLKVEDVSYIFGIVTFVAGVVGVTVGAESARRLRHRTMEADALICGGGILAAIPFIFFTLYSFDKLAFVPWVRTDLSNRCASEVRLTCLWSIVTLCEWLFSQSGWSAKCMIFK